MNYWAALRSLPGGIGSYDEKYIRDYAKRFGFTLRKSGGAVTLTDSAGNTVNCSDMHQRFLRCGFIKRSH